MEITAAAAQATTYTTGKTLAEQINDYLAVSKTSIATLASEIPGYSRPTISRYLSGKYEGDISTIEKLLADWLAQHTGEAVELPEPGRKTGRKPVFYESRDALKVLGVCQSCQEYIGLGIVVARSGYGKTYSLRQYAKLPRVAYIECDDTMSSRDLVEAIEKSLGIPSGYGTIWRRVNGIRDFFNTNKGYLLIIDEADKLVSKYTQKKMEILRAIFDQSDVGLVIAGEPKLEAQIKTYLARMANRVDFYVSLKGLDPSEVEGYLSALEQFETTKIPNEFDVLKNSGTNYAEGVSDVGVIKTKQLTNSGVNTDGIESYFTHETCIENKSTLVVNNDVVFASMGVGSLGKVSLFSYDGDKPFVTDSTLRIYRAKKHTHVLPEVLCIFLQSAIGQELIYRYVVGSTGIINIYDDDIAKIPIPILDGEIQKDIAEKVQNSFALRRQSKQLLEYAKQAVEMAIEQGEDAALVWLKERSGE